MTEAPVRLYRIAAPSQAGRTLTTLRVNGAEHRLAIRPYDVLLDVIRDRIGLTGTRRGCDMGTCGCCAVHVDGRPVLSCLMLALEAEGAEIRTIEGVAAGEPGGALHPLQEAFVQTGGSQCGFCTPGFIMSALALLDRNDDPGEDEIREAISGNVCRCTGYIAIIDSIRMAAKALREKRTSPAGASAPAAAAP